MPWWLYDVKFLWFEKCSIEAVVFLILMAAIYTQGMQESNIFNIICTILKLITLCLIIILGFFSFDFKNLSPFTIKEEGGIEGTFLGASIIFYGYLGFDFITTLSEDSKNPVKDIPSAVLLSSIICTILYFLTAISLVGMARIETLNPETAMADAFY